MAQAVPSIAKRVEAAIRFFEEKGREVSGVTIKGSEFKLDFAEPIKHEIPEADLVDMSK